MISVRGSGLENPLLDDLEAVVSGWGELIVGDTRGNRNPLGDINLAYAGGAVAERRVRLRLGRHLIIPGAARALHLDGLSAELQGPGGVGLSAYAGVPVVPRFAERWAEFSAGGRVHYRPTLESEIGVSFASIVGTGKGLSRRELGLDAHYRLLDSVSVSALARLNTTEQRLAEGEAAVTWQPWRPLDVTLDYRRTAPDLFVPRYSVFSVFTAEKRDDVGGYLALTPARWLAMQAAFHNSRTEAGYGTDTTAKVTLRPGASWTRLGGETRRLHTPLAGYWMGRAFVTQRFSSIWSVYLDVEHYAFFQQINNQSRALFASANIVCDIDAGWRVVLSGYGGENPYATGVFNALLKVAYNGGRVVVEERRP